jgi:probable F420-dependent oxidoreductase
MRIGVVFPQTELGGDAGAVRAYAQRAEELGFTHVLAYDHVLGADPAVHTGWDGPYDVHTTFHEPMVLYGYLAAVTAMELVTGIIILPQRQTALAAKQAAEVDLLTGGKFRLGVGIGWNRVEYQALGQDFSTRGQRLEEQITLLRRLWTEQSVTFSGTFDQITGAGLAPMPVQRPIPVWVGAQSSRAYRRAGRVADGWFPQMALGPQLDQARRIVTEAATEVGRDPASLGMEGRLRWQQDRDSLAAGMRQWQDAGATHLSVNTMGVGLKTVDDHLAALATAAEAAKTISGLAHPAVPSDRTTLGSATPVLDRVCR